MLNGGEETQGIPTKINKKRVSITASALPNLSNLILKVSAKAVI